MAVNKQLTFQTPGSSQSWENESGGERGCRDSVGFVGSALPGHLDSTLLVYLRPMRGPAQHGPHCWSSGVEWPESNHVEPEMKLSEFP